MFAKNFTLGFQVVIKDGDRVLLTKREDYEVWCLPGGGMEEGESFTEAAIRETKEETGLDVAISRLIGVYYRPAENCYNLVYEARVTGGSIGNFPKEVVEAHYFDYRSLPDHTIIFYERMILDAFEFTETVGWKLMTPNPFGDETYRELYIRRDQSGLSRKDFYMKHFGDRADYQEIREF